MSWSVLEIHEKDVMFERVEIYVLVEMHVQLEKIGLFMSILL